MRQQRENHISILNRHISAMSVHGTYYSPTSITYPAEQIGTFQSIFASLIELLFKYKRVRSVNMSIIKCVYRIELYDEIIISNSACRKRNSPSVMRDP